MLMKKNSYENVDVFSQYIQNHFKNYLNKKEELPGEHHFVSLYLLSHILKIVPFEDIKYINPDGVKSKDGDLIYSVNDKEKIIEVKYSSSEKISFTEKQREKLKLDDNRTEYIALFTLKGIPQCWILDKAQLKERAIGQGGKSRLVIDLSRGRFKKDELKCDEDFIKLLYDEAA